MRQCSQRTASGYSKPAAGWDLLCHHFALSSSPNVEHDLNMHAYLEATAEEIGAVDSSPNWSGAQNKTTPAKVNSVLPQTKGTLKIAGPSFVAPCN